MNIIQYYRPNTLSTPFISVWDTTKTSAGSSASNTITLPYQSPLGSYSGTIDWGDGTTSVNSYANRTHIYASSGIYTIKVTGTVVGFSFNNGGDRLKISEIQNFGGINFGNSASYFYGCANLNITATDIPDFTGTTLFNAFFRGCSNLVFNSSVNSWATASVTGFAHCFSFCPLFNQNVGSWNVGAGTSFASMFLQSSIFNNGGSSTIGSWSMGNATDLSNMFSLTAFNQPIGGWNVANVTDFSVMLRSTPFNHPIGSWDVSKGANFNFFMLGKTPANYSAANLDAIYNGWSTRTFVNTGLTISFGTIKYTAAGVAGKAILTGSPNNWTITDGGI